MTIFILTLTALVKHQDHTGFALYVLLMLTLAQPSFAQPVLIFMLTIKLA